MTNFKKSPQLHQIQPPELNQSAYAAAQREQVYRRWLRPLLGDQAWPVSETDRGFLNRHLWPPDWAGLANQLRPCHSWAEVVAQIKAWLLAQPERLLRLLAALRPGQALRRPSLPQLVALALSAGLTAGMVSQPLLALAQGPLGNEFRVNTYTTSNQLRPSVGVDADGDFVVVWTSGAWITGQDGNGYGIYAQRYNAGGTPQESEFQVNTYTTAWQYNSSVGVDSDGDFVVVWHSYGQDGDADGVYARRYNTSGEAQGAEFRVNTYTMGNQGLPSVGMDTDGDFVVAWDSWYQDGHYGGIYAQRYNASGEAQGAEFRVNTYTTSGQSWPSVGLDIDGDFVVAWISDGQDGSGSGIYAQRYKTTGEAQGTEFRVNTYTTGGQSVPSVGVDAAGNFVVAWQSNSQDGDGRGIYAQRYNAGGTPQGSEFRVNTYITGDQLYPSVGVDAAGDFVVAWHSYGQDGDGDGIYARRYNAGGEAQGTEFRVNTYTIGDQSVPSVGLDADGDFVVAWTDDSGQDGDGQGIYAQRYGGPKITINGQGQEIGDGDPSPSAGDGTDFGNVVANSGSLTRTFTISNSGTAELSVGPLLISGTHAGDFSVTQQPSSPVAANGNATFQITFTPSAMGTRVAEVSLTNNGEGKNPYNFAIQGMGAAPPQQAVYLPLVLKE